MKERKYIFIKDENGKRHRYRFIEGDQISQEDLLRDLNQQRIQHLRFQMEHVRTDDTLDEVQKSSRRSMIMWRLKQLQREMDR